MEIESINFFNKKNFLVKEQKIKNAVKTNLSNNIINLKKNEISKSISLDGTIIVDKNLIFENDVKIMPGTRF